MKCIYCESKASTTNILGQDVCEDCENIIIEIQKDAVELFMKL